MSYSHSSNRDPQGYGTQLRVSQKFERLNAPSDSLDSPSDVGFKKKKTSLNFRFGCRRTLENDGHGSDNTKIVFVINYNSFISKTAHELLIFKPTMPSKLQLSRTFSQAGLRYSTRVLANSQS